MAGLRLLVAEDSEPNRIVMGAMLEELGAEASFAPDGAAAVAAIREASFDAVLMDLRMPGMDGQEALARIRGMEVARSGRITPVIAVTAEAHLARGFDKVLTKPFDLDALEAAVAAALGRKPSA